MFGGKANGNSLPSSRAKQRFVIERIDMTGAAMHEQKNDTFERAAEHAANGPPAMQTQLT